MKFSLNLNLNLNLNLSLILCLFFFSCSSSRQLSHSAKEFVLDDEALKTAHVGISIYEPASGKYLYNYQGDKYFVPASNTKLPTCYAAMKYLGDSLVGLRYGIPEEETIRDKYIVIDATADPTFLLEEFKNQPVFDFLRTEFTVNRKLAGILGRRDLVERWGSGWSWNDYQEDYMAERSSLPVFGNLVHIRLKDTSQRLTHEFILPKHLKIGQPFITSSRYFDTMLNGFIRVQPSVFKKLYPEIKITRDIANNFFAVEGGESGFKSANIPFVTDGFSTALKILEDSLKTSFTLVDRGSDNRYDWMSDDGDLFIIHINKWNVIHSQPTDSLLKPMMHRSDNFFAEQSLLMVSNELLGVMNDEKIIDTLLKTDFKDLPQKPVWVDGCGLSRYNLFSPQDMVFILNKMRTDFGMDRIKNIFATGNTGTLSKYYVKENGIIFAKTGTLSGVVALSGFLYTKKNRLLIFSVLVNNHTGSATAVRRAVEKFIERVREKE